MLKRGKYRRKCGCLFLYFSKEVVCLCLMAFRDSRKARLVRALFDVHVRNCFSVINLLMIFVLLRVDYCVLFFVN